MMAGDGDYEHGVFNDDDRSCPDCLARSERLRNLARLIRHHKWRLTKPNMSFALCYVF